MNKPIIFGSLDRFAIEVESLDEKREYGDIYIRICGERVGDGHQVFVPTFTAEICNFARRHQSVPFSVKDFSEISDDAAFNLLHEVVMNGVTSNGLSEREVWGYHFMHSLDDAVDGWPRGLPSCPP